MNETYTIEIKDKKGRVVETHSGVNKFFLLSQTGHEFRKSFSHNDYTEQLGLLDFAQAQLIGEINKLTVNS